MNLYDSKDKIRQQLKQHLKNKFQNVNDRILDELVANILDPDRYVKLYSNHYSNTDYDAISHEYKTRYHKMKEFNFVLITPVKTKDFDVNEDRIWKKKQYKRMFEEMKEKDCFVTVEVTTRAELEAFIKQFIISVANDALHAYIVSNGHGSSDGLGFNGEEHCYNLDDIIRFAKRWFECVDIQVHTPLASQSSYRIRTMFWPSSQQ